MNFQLSVSPRKVIGKSTRQRKKSLTSVGIEATTSGFDHRCSTDWATRPDGSKSVDDEDSNSRQWEREGNFSLYLSHSHCRELPFLSLTTCAV